MRQHCENIGTELKRRDVQIKEMQQRLESNEGCKYYIFKLISHILLVMVPIQLIW